MLRLLSHVAFSGIPVAIIVLLWRSDLSWTNQAVVVAALFATFQYLKIKVFSVETFNEHQDPSHKSKYSTACSLDTDSRLTPEACCTSYSKRSREKRARVQLDEPEPPSNAALKETMVGTIRTLEAGWSGLAPLLDDGALKVWHRPEVNLRTFLAPLLRPLVLF